jgi:hypothetical protein
MNKIIISVIVIFFSVLSAQAQNEKWIVGANTNYNLPIGGLADRMEANMGGLIYAGKKVDQDWTWVGKLEYFKLTDVNRDQMFKIVKAEINDIVSDYRFELPLIEMELTTAGLSVEARYSVFNSAIFEADLNFGFGFYYWEYSRSGYQDSLFIDTTGSGDLLLAEFLNVPPLFQNDWSGGINIGTDFNFIFLDPLSFNLGINYKLLITELWPSLSLNLENVSGLQFLDLRAGIRVRL